MKRHLIAIIVLTMVIIGFQYSRNQLMAQEYYSPVINYGNIALNTHVNNDKTFINQKLINSIDSKYLKRFNLNYIDWLVNNQDKYLQPVDVPDFDENNILPVSSEALKVSNEWLKNSYLASYKAIPDGFIDAPIGVVRINESGKPQHKNKVREYIIVDKNKDGKLAKLTNDFKLVCYNSFMSEEQKVYLLFTFVDKIFSNGSDKRLTERSNAFNKGKALYLGEIVNSGSGVCRHRALLAKILGDAGGINISLVRGYFAGNLHAWNEVTLRNGQTYILDIMHRRIINISYEPHLASYYRSVRGENIYLTVKI